MSDSNRTSRWPRRLMIMTFVSVFLFHALYLRHIAAEPSDGWADIGVSIGLFGFGPYFRAHDYFLGFSYALSAAFAAWGVAQFIISRRRAASIGAAGGVTFVSLLIAGGCFLIGCCGSPMLPIYVALFGANALGFTKPLIAAITLLFVSCAYWCLARRLKQSGCIDSCCNDISQCAGDLREDAKPHG